jgi:hypothetical protein
VLLTVTLRPGAHLILEVSVSAAGKETLYLVDPRGGSLRVKAAEATADREGGAAAAAKEVSAASGRQAVEMAWMAMMAEGDGAVGTERAGAFESCMIRRRRPILM